MIPTTPQSQRQPSQSYEPMTTPPRHYQDDDDDNNNNNNNSHNERRIPPFPSPHHQVPQYNHHSTTITASHNTTTAPQQRQRRRNKASSSTTSVSSNSSAGSGNSNNRHAHNIPTSHHHSARYPSARHSKRRLKNTSVHQPQVPSLLYSHQNNNSSSGTHLSGLPQQQPHSGYPPHQPQQQQQQHFYPFRGSGDSPHPPKPPSLRDIRIVLRDTLSLYILHYYRHTWKTPCRRLRRWTLWGLGIAGFLLCIVPLIVLTTFTRDALQICTPPPSTESLMEGRPLVEYYVHGRGNGHYARSIAIVEQLNQAGIDVRMFIGRATMYKAFHEAQHPTFHNKDEDNHHPVEGHNNSPPQKGITTAIAVTSITPQLDFFASISHTFERIMGDCEVAVQTQKYPSLVIADGDMPGMIRAKLGGIPSVAISHGQIFHIVQEPAWLQQQQQQQASGLLSGQKSDSTTTTRNNYFSRPWTREGRLNWFASLGSNWQIATNFISGLEPQYSTAAVAQPPLRPEILESSNIRHHFVRTKSDRDVSSASVPLKSTTTTTSPPPPPLPPTLVQQLTTMANDHQESDLSTLLELSWWLPKNQTSSSEAAPASQQPPRQRRRRKFVICYFRDDNGEAVTQALLQSGFDVVNFEKGYHRDHKNENEFQTKWIVPRHLLPLSTKGKDANNDSAAPALPKPVSSTKKQKARNTNDIMNQIQNRIQKNTNNNTPPKTPAIKKTTNLGKSSGAAKMTLNDKAKAALAAAQFHKVGKHNIHNKMEHRRQLLAEESNDLTSTHKNHHLKDDGLLPPPRLIRVTDRSLFVPLMTIADGVASSAGSQLLSECIYMNMPLFALYLQGDDEQELNIAMSRHHNKVSKKQKRYDVFGTSFEEFRNKNHSPSKQQNSTTTTTTTTNIVTGLRGGGSSSTSAGTAVTQHDEFDAFVETVQKSTVSQSFFESLAQTQHESNEGDKVSEKNHASSTLTSTMSSSSNNTAIRKDAKSTAATTTTTSGKNNGEEEEEEENDESTTASTTTTISSSTDDLHHDPFRGMPDAAAVILEIIKEVQNSD